MKVIDLNDQRDLHQINLLNNNTIQFKQSGGYISLEEIVNTSKRYLYIDLTSLEENSSVFHLGFYKRNSNSPTMTIRFGILPKIRSQVLIDLEWLKGNILFPPNVPGMLKIVCHGSRIDKDEVSKVLFESYSSYKDTNIQFHQMYLTDTPPKIEVTKELLIDKFGQFKLKNWSSKITEIEQLIERLDQMISDNQIDNNNKSKYFGDLNSPLIQGTRFFTKTKHNKQWNLVDPDGNAFLTMGANGIRPFIDGRIDGIESMLEWIPENDSYAYENFVTEREIKTANPYRPLTRIIDFLGINLYQVWGEEWENKWKALVEAIYRKYQFSTIGNWSDLKRLEGVEIPYVTSLQEFPSTNINIFRDFPDVMSIEYSQNAKRCAQSLENTKNDPWMVGYFLRNEPSWAFVDNLMIADEVFYNVHETETKKYLIEKLKNKYENLGDFNQAYHLNLDSWDDLKHSIKDLSKKSEIANLDMREFSRELFKRYIEIPVNECRKVDPNHMILGLRWAWIANPDFITGWELFDAFSINCYAENPVKVLDNLVKLGIDCPVIIGEFHFGALDVGLPATGLEGVVSQRDRGLSYRHYCENAIAHPLCVGCHYFQFYDQFALGRFDGENYNIGLLDICSQPYDDMLNEVLKCHETIYDVKAKRIKPTSEKGQSIPMIAY